MAMNIVREETKKLSEENGSLSSGVRKILADEYIILKKIGSGSFGKVYLAEYKQSKKDVAVKFERKEKISRLINEYKIYRYLDYMGFKEGLPKIYDWKELEDYNVLIMQLLGVNLESLLNKFNRRFKLSTVLKLANTLITLLESMHKIGFIHRDIKPNNFMIGKDEDKGQVYIMDFGLSKKYTSKGRHMKFREGRSLIGTARYASINMHMGMEPSRRDDLESVGYMLIYFLKGKLPWQGLKKESGANHVETIGEVKICTSINKLCEGIPLCFGEYMRYCRNLKFKEDPDYDYLRGLFYNLCLNNKIIPKYEWCD